MGEEAALSEATEETDKTCGAGEVVPGEVCRHTGSHHVARQEWLEYGEQQRWRQCVVGAGC